MFLCFMVFTWGCSQPWEWSRIWGNQWCYVATSSTWTTSSLLLCALVVGVTAPGFQTMTNLFRIAKSPLHSGFSLCWSEVKVDFFFCVFTQKTKTPCYIYLYISEGSNLTGHDHILSKDFNWNWLVWRTNAYWAVRKTHAHKWWSHVAHIYTNIWSSDWHFTGCMCVRCALWPADGGEFCAQLSTTDWFNRKVLALVVI